MAPKPKPRDAAVSSEDVVQGNVLWLPTLAEVKATSRARCGTPQQAVDHLTGHMSHPGLCNHPIVVLSRGDSEVMEFVSCTSFHGHSIQEHLRITRKNWSAFHCATFVPLEHNSERHPAAIAGDHLYDPITLQNNEMMKKACYINARQIWIMSWRDVERYWGSEPGVRRAYRLDAASLRRLLTVADILQRERKPERLGPQPEPYDPGEQYDTIIERQRPSSARPTTPEFRRYVLNRGSPRSMSAPDHPHLSTRHASFQRTATPEFPRYIFNHSPPKNTPTPNTHPAYHPTFSPLPATNALHLLPRTIEDSAIFRRDWAPRPYKHTPLPAASQAFLGPSVEEHRQLLDERSEGTTESSPGAIDRPLIRLARQARALAGELLGLVRWLLALLARRVKGGDRDGDGDGERVEQL